MANLSRFRRNAASADAVLLPSRQWWVNRLIWLTLFVIGAIDGVWIALAGLTPVFAGIGIYLGIIGLCLAIALIYRYIRRDDTLSLAGNLFAQSIAATLVISVFSYLTTRFNMPYIDASLLSADQMLGFHWQDYAAWLERYPPVAHTLYYAYNLCPQEYLIFILLLCYRHSAQGQRMVMLLLITGIVTAILGGLFPALGMYSNDSVNPALYPQVRHFDFASYQKTLTAARAQTALTVPVPGPPMVTFPSFHTIITVLLVYGVLPLCWLRVPVLLLNLCCLLAIPVYGGHYLIDMLAGLAIVAAGIIATERLLPRALAPA